MTDDQLAMFEQPASGDTAVLACAHRVPLPRNPRRTTDDWYAAIHCPACRRAVQVAAVIYTSAREDNAA